ncbi:MAG: hypothetical protein GY811_28825 [Myxococcales bacterium]|nr:hypothetical protein [Myxococcales bacterium]
MKANTASHEFNPPREPAMLVCDPRDRRMSIRWRPLATTKAEVTSPRCSWSGRVLNLSQDGAEIEGLPPAIWTSLSEVKIAIEFREYAVEWYGTLQRIKPHSHVVVFGNAPLLREEQYVCDLCGDKVLTYRHRSRATGGALICTICELQEEEDLQLDSQHLGVA